MTTEISIFTEQGFATRFWLKVEKTSRCWNWIAATNGVGYGVISAGAMRLAHRIAWTMKNGAIPRGMFVLHRCDNPRCVRPSHLFLGTQADNMRDMREKGRHGYRSHSGDENGRAKLNRSRVERMRRVRAKTGASYSKLGRMFGIDTSTAHRAVTGRRWA